MNGFTTITLVSINCADCSTLFAMEDRINKIRHEDGRRFYCPNGHSNYFPQHEQELERLKRENQRLTSRAIYAESEAEDAKRSKAAIKGQLTKTRNRIANGVCPCCHRTFKQLASHMSNKHPEFKEAVS